MHRPAWPTFAVVVVVVCFLSEGCDKSSSTTPTAPNAPQQSSSGSADQTPAVVADELHSIAGRKPGDFKPYLVKSGPSIVLDSGALTLRDPSHLARMPNAVQVRIEQSLYQATWPASSSGKGSIKLDTTTLKTVQGESFPGFVRGKEVFVAIGFVEPDSTSDGKAHFTPFWIGSLIVI